MKSIEETIVLRTTARRTGSQARTVKIRRLKRLGVAKETAVKVADSASWPQPRGLVGFRVRSLVKLRRIYQCRRSAETLHDRTHNLKAHTSNLHSQILVRSFYWFHLALILKGTRHE